MGRSGIFLIVQIPKVLKARLRRIARAEFRTLSDVVRIALVATVRQGHTPNTDPPAPTAERR